MAGNRRKATTSVEAWRDVYRDKRRGSAFLTEARFTNVYWQFLEEKGATQSSVGIAGRTGSVPNATVNDYCPDGGVDFLPASSPFSTSTAFSSCAPRCLMKSSGVLSTYTSGGTPKFSMFSPVAV